MATVVLVWQGKRRKSQNGPGPFPLLEVTGPVLAATGWTFTLPGSPLIPYLLAVSRPRVLADLINEIAKHLDLEPGPRAELSAAAVQVSAAIDDPIADKGGMRWALDAVLGPVKLVGATALMNAAISVGNKGGVELDAAIHHLHPSRRAGRCGRAVSRGSTLVTGS